MILVLSVYGQLTIKDLSIGLTVSVNVKQWIKILMILFKFVQLYNPQSVGIEVSGQQGGCWWIGQKCLGVIYSSHWLQKVMKGEQVLDPTTSSFKDST